MPTVDQSCAIGPSYQGGPNTKADPYKTTCTAFDFKPTSIYPNSAQQIPGSCLGTTFLYKVVDADKTYDCTGQTQEGKLLGFAFDILSKEAVTYQYRVVPMALPHAPPPVVIGIAPSTGIPFVVGTAKDSQRIVASVKAPSNTVLFQIKVPVGTVLGPFCWQTPAITVE